MLLTTFDMIMGALLITLIGMPQIKLLDSFYIFFGVYLFQALTAGFMVPREQLLHAMHTDIIIQLSMTYQALSQIFFDFLHNRTFDCPYGVEAISCGPLTKYSGDALLLATGYYQQHTTLSTWVLISVMVVTISISFAHAYFSHSMGDKATHKEVTALPTAPVSKSFSIQEVVRTSLATKMLDAMNNNPALLRDRFAQSAKETNKNVGIRSAARRMISSLPQSTASGSEDSAARQSVVDESKAIESIV